MWLDNQSRIDRLEEQVHDLALTVKHLEGRLERIEEMLRDRPLWSWRRWGGSR